MKSTHALSVLKKVDFTPIVQEQFDKMASYLANAAKVSIDKVNIYSTYTGANVELNYMRPNFNAQLTTDAIVKILQPPMVLRFVKKELAQMVIKQFEYLTDTFARKEGVDKECISIVTQHHSTEATKVFISISGEYRYELSIGQVAELVHKNF